MRVHCFPYRFGITSDKKIIPYPYAPVYFFTSFGKKRVSLLVDSGADLTTLSDDYIDLLGVLRKNLIKTECNGVGGMVFAWEAEIKIEFCGLQMKIPVQFIKNDHDTPLILGKLGIWDKFNVLFNNKKKMTEFEEIK